MDIQAAVIHEPGSDYKLENITLDKPKENEVLIRIVASGICHTDLSAQNQNLPVPLPAVLGHEGAGIIEEVGEGIKELSKGDQVVLSYTSCGECEYCLTGHPHACEHILSANFGGEMSDHTHRLHKQDEDISNFFGQSSFATYAVANVRNVVKVDNDVDLQLLAPLGCGVQTGAGAILNVFTPSPSSSVVVFGGGTVGMSALMAAKASGCRTIIVVDLNESRLELAHELGATHTINPSKTDVVEEIKRITGKGANYAIESTGVPEVLSNAVLSLAPMGKAGVIGAPKMGTKVEIDVMDMLINVKEIVGIHQGSSVPKVFIPELIELYKQGRLPLEKLITVYDFQDINKAVEATKKGTAIKPVLTMQ